MTQNVYQDKRYPERDTGHTIEGASWHNYKDKLESHGDINSAELPKILTENECAEITDKNASGHYPNMLFDQHNCDLFD